MLPRPTHLRLSGKCMATAVSCLGSVMTRDPLGKAPAPVDGQLGASRTGIRSYRFPFERTALVWEICSSVEQPSHLLNVRVESLMGLCR